MIECRCLDAGALLRFVSMEQNPNGGPGQPVPPGPQPQESPDSPYSWQPPPKPQRPGPEAYVVQSGKRNRIGSLFLGLFCAALGGGAVYSLCIGAVNGGTGAAIIGGIIGGSLLFIGICGLLAAVFMRNSVFVIDKSAIRTQGTRLTDWRVEWDEVAAMALVKMQRLVRDDQHWHRWRRRDYAWLELIPVDFDAFQANHHLLAKYCDYHFGYWAYRLSFDMFGTSADVQTDARLRAIAPEHYHGIVDKGVVKGMRPV